MADQLHHLGTHIACSRQGASRFRRPPGPFNRFGEGVSSVPQLLRGRLFAATRLFALFGAALMLASGVMLLTFYILAP